jgi:hypothetical protein
MEEFDSDQYFQIFISGTGLVGAPFCFFGQKFLPLRRVVNVIRTKGLQSSVGMIKLLFITPTVNRNVLTLRNNGFFISYL